MENWKPVGGFEGLYEVSNHGYVRSLHKGPKRFGRILKSKVGNCGYSYVILQHAGIKKALNVHRLVALAFVSNPKNKPAVNHKDGDKQNNRFGNLERATNSENRLHACRTGLACDQLGQTNPSAKLTEDSVRTIRELRQQGFKLTDIAARFGISFGHVSSLCLRKRWQHLN